MTQSRHRTYLLTGTLLTGMLVAFFLAVLSGGAKARAEVGDPVLVAAGDIADCTSPNDEATAALLGTMPTDAKVATLGDGAYPKGSASDYQNCYDPSWGAYKDFGDGSPRTLPTAGNHDYMTAGASGYFGYFGAAAGDPTKGYYSYELGSWHMVVLNSNCTKVGGCTATSPQVQWLKSDLYAHRSASCTLAYWHEPRFSSVQTGTRLKPFWNVLYKNGADVVLNGHQHNYERFAPQSPSGALDTAKGIREFVVGTGGETLHPFTTAIMANSEVREASTFGVLKLTLHANSYDWQFVPVAGQTFADSGSTACH
jgi:acid phosphatase type 7